MTRTLMKLWPFCRTPRRQWDARDAENTVINLLRHFPNAEADWDEEELLGKMTADGMDEQLAWIMIGLVPIYAGRLLLEQVEPKFSDKVDILHPDGRRESHALSSFIPWHAISANAAKIREHPNFKTIALSGAEVNVVNEMLNSGSQPENLILTPPLLSTRG